MMMNKDRRVAINPPNKYLRNNSPNKKTVSKKTGGKKKPNKNKTKTGSENKLKK